MSKTITTTTIIPAQPGFSVAHFFSACKEYAAAFSFEPIVAWRVVVEQEGDMGRNYAFPITMSGSYWDTDAVGAYATVRFPDGRFDFAGDTIIENEEEALAHAIEEKENEKRWRLAALPA